MPSDAGSLCKTTVTSDLYKSRDTYGNFLRLVRPTRPCRGKLVSIRRTRLCEPAFGRSPDIGGNFLRPVPLARPCFRRHAATARIAHPSTVVHSNAARPNLNGLGKGRDRNYKKGSCRCGAERVVAHCFQHFLSSSCYVPVNRDAASAASSCRGNGRSPHSVVFNFGSFDPNIDTRPIVI